jgi:hypothetical protein
VLGFRVVTGREAVAGGMGKARTKVKVLTDIGTTSIYSILCLKFLLQEARWVQVCL